jgi:hypothetical protein
MAVLGSFSGFAVGTFAEFRVRNKNGGIGTSCEGARC